MIKIEQLKLPIGFTLDNIKKEIAHTLNIFECDIYEIEILKQSIDARKKPNVIYVLNVSATLKNNLENKFSNLLYTPENLNYDYEKKSLRLSPIVVGFGPSGMFCGLTLAKMGLNPIIIEQGKMVDEREIDVNTFWNNGKLNVYSNVQFGEGGAGTFSDGKLNTNLNNKYCKIIINELYHFGAPKEILYLSKPHIGSDNLKKVVKNIREEIISLGGTIYFSHKLEDIEIENNTINNIAVRDIVNDKKIHFETNNLILCVGHSARDCFKMLHEKNVIIKQKPFAMGVRIEQLQHDINESQYGKNFDKRLTNADYKLAVHLPNGRNVFTFCMCPGGVVVGSSSNTGEVVTNGMSYFARDKVNANSAVLVNVTPSDYSSNHPLAGVYFQQKYEQLAFDLGGKNYNAPAQSVYSFLTGKENNKSIQTSFKPNIKYANLSKCLPDFVTESLKMGLPLLNEKLNNFAKDNSLLIGVESRSSSPITIERNENFESNIKGLYPCGEGAGYAGGIVSSAQDGIKVAEAIYNNIK